MALYENFVLAEQIDSILSTKLDVNRFMTIDTSLTQEPGQKKKVHKYSGTGAVEDLAKGAKNSSFVDAGFTEVEYTVKRTQGTAKYFDDDAMSDPTYVEAKLKYLAEGMVNNWTAKAIAEFGKTDKTYTMTNYTLAEFAGAISQYTKEYESTEGLFFVINIELVPKIQELLGEHLKYTEDYIRTGAIGAILGVPIYSSKAVPADTMYLATNEAVTAFIKKNTFVEQDRDVETKENIIVATRYAVIALTNAKKCIKCAPASVLGK